MCLSIFWTIGIIQGFSPGAATGVWEGQKYVPPPSPPVVGRDNMVEWDI